MRFGWLTLTATCFIGCGGTDFMGTPLVTAGRDAGQAAQVSDGGTSSSNCGPKQAPMDPASLPACCQGVGQAHCVPSDKLSPALASQLSPCAQGGSCVPDPFIKSGGATPPSCKSLNGADGVCMSLCVPMVAMYKDLLPQATCGADERCAPCINPLNNMRSGACEIGKQQDCSQPGGPSPSTGDGGATMQAVCPHVGPPVLDPASLPSCFPGGGAHCIQAALVPPAMASQLAACPTGLCAPDVAIAAGGQFISKSCSSLDGAEGRCLHDAIPQVAKQLSMLPQDVCEAFEKCVPCYSPIDGKPTGACTQSCDPGPVKPAVTFAACCNNNNHVTEGKCVPTTVIPMTLQRNLGADSCNQTTELCVPTENLNPDFKPPACSAFNLLLGNYTGVCLSECLEFGLQSLGISRGNCDDQHRCVPCTQGGKPTGAPGCPSTP